MPYNNASARFNIQRPSPFQRQNNIATLSFALSASVDAIVSNVSNDSSSRCPRWSKRRVYLLLLECLKFFGGSRGQGAEEVVVVGQDAFGSLTQPGGPRTRPHCRKPAPLQLRPLPSARRRNQTSLFQGSFRVIFTSGGPEFNCTTCFRVARLKYWLGVQHFH